MPLLINNDGIPELLLLTRTKDYSGTFVVDDDRPFILTLFTLVDNEPVHLAYYWRRERIQISADGTIYYIGGLGGSYTGLRSYALDAGASELRQLSEFHRDSGIFFSGTFDEQIPMLEEEFNELYKKYTELPNPMKFSFIPLAQ